MRFLVLEFHLLAQESARLTSQDVHSIVWTVQPGDVRHDPNVAIAGSKNKFQPGD